MKRILAVVILAEVLVGIFLIRQRLLRYSPPMAEYAYIDTLTAQHLREKAAQCRTADDWQALGEAYMSVGYFPEAEACHRVAVEMKPNDSRLVYEWAFALERLGQTSDAIREYRKAADLGHLRAAECRYYAARNMLREEKPHEAHHELENAVSVPYARYELARLYFRAEKYDAAAALVEQLLFEFPDAIQPALLRHRLAHQHQDRHAAFRYADREMTARRRLPNPFDHDFERLMNAHAKLGLVSRWKEAERLVKDGKFAQAEPKLRDGLAVRWHPTGADLLAEVEFQRGQKQTALALFNEIITRDGPSAYNVGRLGDALHESGQEADARAAWLRATKLGSAVEAKDYYYKLALSYEQAKDTAAQKVSMALALQCAAIEQLRNAVFADADNLLTEALKNDPKLANAWFLRGEVARRTGRREAALSAYQTCLQLDPYHGRATTVLAFLTGGK